MKDCFTAEKRPEKMGPSPFGKHHHVNISLLYQYPYHPWEWYIMYIYLH